MSVTFVTSSTALSGVPALSCAVPPAIWLSITLTSFTVKGPNPSGAGQADSSAFFCVHLHRSRRSASSTGAAAWVTFSTTCPPSNRVPVNSVEQCQCSSVQPAWQQVGGCHALYRSYITFTQHTQDRRFHSTQFHQVVKRLNVGSTRSRSRRLTTKQSALGRCTRRRPEGISVLLEEVSRLRQRSCDTRTRLRTTFAEITSEHKNPGSLL